MPTCTPSLSASSDRESRPVSWTFQPKNRLTCALCRKIIGTHQIAKGIRSHQHGVTVMHLQCADKHLTPTPKKRGVKR